MKPRIFLLILILTLISVFASYTEIKLDNVQGLKYSSMASADFNLDTNLEIIMCGQRTGPETSRTILYKINNNNFTEIPTNIINVTYCSISIIDLNNNSYDDIVISGQFEDKPIMRVYKNNNNFNFTLHQAEESYSDENIVTNLIGKTMSDSVVGDLNNNGLLDLVIMGCNEPIDKLTECSNFSTEVYINNGTYLNFNQTWSENLTKAWQGSLALGDFNKNNFLDLALSGCNSNLSSYNCAITQIFNNTNNTFTKNNDIEIEGVWWGSIAFEDFNKNGHLDLFISGLNNSNVPVTKVYTSDNNLYTTPARTILPPNITKLNYNGTHMQIEWENLNVFNVYYNIKIGSSENKFDIISDISPRSSNPTQGYFGNMMLKNRVNLKMPNRCSYIQVQAITPDMQRSNWSNVKRWNNNGIEVCNGFDTNCSGRADDAWDKDKDGFVGEEYKDICILLGPDYKFDCDDNDPKVFPGSTHCGFKDYNCSGDVNLCSETVISGGGGARIQETITEKTEEKDDNDRSGLIDYRDILPPEKEIETTPQLESPGSSYTASEVFNEIEEKIIHDLVNLSLQLRINPVPILDGQGNTIIEFRVRNLNMFEREAYIQKIIPEDIIENTDMIEPIRGYEYDIVKYDTIIGFSLHLNPNQEKVFRYKINRILTEEDIRKITYLIIEDEERQRELKKTIEETIIRTREVINLTQSYYINNVTNQTTFVIDIDFDRSKSLVNVSIYQEIPKCLIEIITAELVHSQNRMFEILNEDPLIVWHFDNLIDAEQIQYTINAIADEDCTNQILALAAAREIIHSVSYQQLNYSNVFWAVSIIPFLAILMIIFSIISTKIEHKDEEVRKLVEYIKKHYRNGFNKNELKKKLLDSGYDESIVEECLHLHTKNKFHYWIHRLEIGFNELILFILIALNIIDFIEAGTLFSSVFDNVGIIGDIGYLKKIISWVLLSYLLYRGSITKILFGVKNKIIDICLIFAFFSLTLKNLIGFARVGLSEVYYVADLYVYLINNNVLFEQFVFIGGLIALIIISIIITLYIPFKDPSFACSLHLKEGKVKGIKILSRFIFVHLILLGFFIIIFNLMMEWLAIAVDSLLIVVTLITVIFLIVKHHKKFTARKFMEETAESSEKFYEKFIDLFHYKKTIYLGISGMLVLHALTEVGSFIVPYVLGVRNPVYFGNSIMAINHNPLFFSIVENIEPLFQLQTNGFSAILKFQVAYVYIMNIIAIIALFIIPALIWYNYFKNKNVPVKDVIPFSFGKGKIKSSITVGLLLSSFYIFFTRPVFILKPFLGGEDLMGVDILTKAISMNNIAFICITSIIIFFIAFGINFYKKEFANFSILPISYLFFINYIYMFANSAFGSKINQATILLNINYFMAFYIIILAFISITVLYLLGSIITTYIYLPHFLKEVIAKIPIINLLFSKHDLHHIHHFDSHNDSKHLEKEIAVKNYILKSLDSGHELFYAVEHLVAHGWPVKIIEESIQLVKHDKLYQEEIRHISHYHHNESQIKDLSEWIYKSYDNNKLTKIIETAEENGWTDDDLILAIKILKNKIKFRKEDSEIIKYMKIIE